MNRTLVTIVAMTLLVVGAWLIVRLRPNQLDEGQAGIAYVEQADGSFAPASIERAPERTKPAEASPTTVDAQASTVNEDTHAADVSTAKSEAASKHPATDDKGKPKPKGSEKPWLTEFELTERSGKLISSQSFLGQPYVIGFFYATCPSICVRQNEKFKILQEKFRGQPIRLVEISCDPEVDRPEVLAEYANRFDADPEQWLFFTGEMDYISRVGSEMYSIGVLRRGHPEKFVLLDAQGKIYGYYTWSDAAQWQTLQRDMAKLIAEQVK